MKIGEIDLVKIAPLQKKERAFFTKIEDRISLSPAAVEAQKEARIEMEKRANFVKMLEQMPEVSSLPLDSSSDVERALAEQIYQELFAQ